MTDHNMSVMPANGAADEAAMKDWAELLVARARFDFDLYINYRPFSCGPDSANTSPMSGLESSAPLSLRRGQQPEFRGL